MRGNEVRRFRHAIKDLRNIERLSVDEPRLELLADRVVRSCQSAAEYARCAGESGTAPSKSSEVMVGLPYHPFRPDPSRTEFCADLVSTYDKLRELEQSNEKYGWNSPDHDLTSATESMKLVSDRAQIVLKIHRGICAAFHVGPVLFPQPLDATAHRLRIDTALAIELSVIFRRFTARWKSSGKYRFKNHTFCEIPSYLDVSKFRHGHPCWKNVAQFVNQTFQSSGHSNDYRQIYRMTNAKQMDDRVNRFLRRNPEVVLEKWRLDSAPLTTIDM